MKRNNALITILMAIVMILSMAVPGFAADPNQPRDPATGRDYVWEIDFGSGSWEIDGQTVTVNNRNGAPITGVYGLTYMENFKITGLTGERSYRFFLSGSNGFKAELDPTGDLQMAVGRRKDEYKETVIPKKGLSFVIEADKGEGPGAEDPERFSRMIDYGSGSWNIEGSEVTASIDGKPAAGQIETDAGQPIKLNGLNRETMKVKLSAADGFSVFLVLNGDDEVNLNRLENDAHLPDTMLSFTVEKAEDHGDPGQAGPSPEGPGPGNDGPGPENQDKVYKVNFGSGRWELEGAEKPVFTRMDGHTVDGVLAIGENAPIYLEDFDAETMRARVTSKEGFSALLAVDNNGEVRLSDTEYRDVHLPDEMDFVVELNPSKHIPGWKEPISRYDDEPQRSPVTAIIIAAAAVVVVAAAAVIIVKKRKIK